MSEAVVLDPPVTAATTAEVIAVGPLSAAAVGARGVIVRVHPADGALVADELERRLLELGFVEGAAVDILHEGAFGGDPIAVRLDDMRVAIRRREAAAIQVRFEAGADA
jgi:ferrous iron transport protein A